MPWPHASRGGRSEQAAEDAGLESVHLRAEGQAMQIGLLPKPRPEVLPALCQSNSAERGVAARIGDRPSGVHAAVGVVHARSWGQTSNRLQRATPLIEPRASTSRQAPLPGN